MKVFRLAIVPVLVSSLAALACAGGPGFVIPALATQTARAQLTSVVAAGGAYPLDNGLTIDSTETTQKAIDGGTVLALESLAKERYQATELSRAGHTYAYTITLDKDRQLLWQTSWCTTTAEGLKQNLSHLHVVFRAGRQTVEPGHIATFTARNGDLYCALAMVSVSGWPQGKTVLDTDVTFDAPINDGLADYPKGTHTYEYTVTRK
jgi:hypothetical protein